MVCVRVAKVDRISAKLTKGRAKKKCSVDDMDSETESSRKLAAKVASKANIRITSMKSGKVQIHRRCG